MVAYAIVDVDIHDIEHFLEYQHSGELSTSDVLLNKLPIDPIFWSL